MTTSLDEPSLRARSQSPSDAMSSFRHSATLSSSSASTSASTASVSCRSTSVGRKLTRGCSAAHEQMCWPKPLASSSTRRVVDCPSSGASVRRIGSRFASTEPAVDQLLRGCSEGFGIAIMVRAEVATMRCANVGRGRRARASETDASAGDVPPAWADRRTRMLSSARKARRRRCNGRQVNVRTSTCPRPQRACPPSPPAGC